MKKQVKKNGQYKNELQEYFRTFLFPRVRAGREKTYSESKPLKTALDYKYIDPNNNGYIRVLTVDIDWDIPMDEYISRIPLPNVIVSNPENGHKQIMYFFRSRLYRGNAKIMYAYQMIKNNLNRTLKGDFCFAGRLQKNPLHSCWNAVWFNNDPYSLTDLINWSMKQETDIKEASCRVHDFTSRNETVFRSLLKYACRRNKELSYEMLESQAEYLNNLIPSEFDTAIKTPLGFTELRGIARSVWKFMKTRYTGRSENGGGQYSDEQRKKSIKTRVAKKWKNIYRFIAYRKMKLSFKEIAVKLGATQKTIKNYARAVKGSGNMLCSANAVRSYYSLKLTKNRNNYATNNTATAPRLPPVIRGITDTVFHRINGFPGVGGAGIWGLSPNTS